MLRPPYLARVAAGACVFAIEETRRLPGRALHFPITAISQLLQTTMHAQQFVTSLALRGDSVLDRWTSPAVEQPDWATFDQDDTTSSTFDVYTSVDVDEVVSTATVEEPAAEAATEIAATVTEVEVVAAAEAIAEAAAGAQAAAEAAEEADAEVEPAATEPAGAFEPEVATRLDYANMSIAQLRARLRRLTEEELAELLEFEQRTFTRAAFVTMLTNRIATVQAAK
ncbi:lipid droplet-associated protein [Nocardia stercoris]|uniref:Lipid droplet-associated protein n=1 Tax=Nocardia stercoris TaxID=2483361 RepID=A0A3M2LJM5_9NOCA|nr:lipid droplet-associated protein [Nocardia stercoris]RMI34968.1 lipid droplet-associated protein [Nocardia stercoris]